MQNPISANICKAKKVLTDAKAPASRSPVEKAQESPSRCNAQEALTVVQVPEVSTGVKKSQQTYIPTSPNRCRAQEVPIDAKSNKS